ncbi:diaminopimelate decarboxylase [Halostagnicola bangensis]
MGSAAAEGSSNANPSSGAQIRRLEDWNASELDALLESYGSPLYVLDVERVRENARRLADAFPDADVLYALKANALGDVLETVIDEGVGLECASAGELHRALEAGASGEEVHYTAVNPPAADLEYVVERWREEPALTVTAGSADTIDRLEERGYDGRLCLRVNPGIGAGHHEKVRTGANAKFGVPAERAVDVLSDAADRGFDVVGVHAHVGSGVSGDALESHREFVSRMGEIARSVSDAVGGLEFVDVGGGFGVPYREEEAPLNLEAVAEATRSALGEIDATLTIEPGRYFVADAGVLLTHVNTVKEARETTVVGTDAGMTTLLRPAMYDSYHPIRNVTAELVDDERAVDEQTVAGPICESGDVFCTDRPFASSERGDALAIGNAGAYGYEMANQYNSRPRPASVVVETGSVGASGTTAADATGCESTGWAADARLSRRRESMADVVRHEEELTR